MNFLLHLLLPIVHNVSPAERFTCRTFHLDRLRGVPDNHGFSVQRRRYLSGGMENRIFVIPGGSQNPIIAVVLGNGDGTFQAAKNTSAQADPLAVAVGDFNKDGQLLLLPSAAASTCSSETEMARSRLQSSIRPTWSRILW